MKKRICALLACVMLFSCALAEPAETQIIAVTPAPTLGETFASEDIIVSLPAGMQILSGDELEGYASAVQADYPNGGALLMAAADESFGRVLYFSIIDEQRPAADAASEAARIILGDKAAVTEAQYGENTCAYFTCGIGEDVYRLYFLEGENNLLLIGASGVADAELEAMLTGLEY